MIRPAGDSSEDDEYGDFLDNGTANEAFKRRGSSVLDIQQVAHNLFTAIINGNKESVLSILDNGFDVNAMLKDNWTPLLLAASIGDPDITEVLLNQNADVNTNIDFYTALMAASSCPLYTSPYEKSLEVVKQLINHGADVNVKTRKRMTALMFAASNGNLGIIKTLLPICDKNAEDNQGWTAVFWAVNDNKPEVLKLLLEAGLEIEKFDVRGNIPYDYAKRNDFEEIVDMLPSHEKEKKSKEVPQTAYNIDELFQSERPTFLRDVCIMLYGMKSECYTELIINNNIDLFKFLTFTDQDLLNLGIKAPYQRYRILSGLYKFHKHMFKTKSIPIIPQDALYSTIDVFSSITVACKHLIVMEAGFRYLLQSAESVEELRDVQKQIEQIKTKLACVKITASAINSQAKQWDFQNNPADLITASLCKKLGDSNFKKYTTIGTVSILTLIIIRKLYFS